MEGGHRRSRVGFSGVAGLIESALMPVIQIASCDVLREERNELLTVVAEELARDPRRRNLIKLLHDRLKGISKEMGDRKVSKCSRRGTVHGPDSGIGGRFTLRLQRTFQVLPSGG